MSRLALPIAVGSVFALLAALSPAADPDVFWHLRLGQEILRGELPRTDTYSWTIRGAALPVDQWLGQAAFALAYEALGWKGVVLLRALAGGAVVALVLLAAQAERVRPLGAVLAALPAAVLLRDVWTERPQLLGFVFFALLILLLRRVMRGETRALWAAVPLLGVWANVHGSYALGLAILLPVALWTRRPVAIAAAALATLATLATPAGLGTVGPPSGHFLAPPRYIQEWAVPDPTTPAGLVFALVLGAVLVCALLGRPAGREALILVPVVLVSLTAARHAAFLAIAAAPFLAAHGPAALRTLGAGRWARRARPVPESAPRFMTATSLAIALAALGASLVLAPPRPELGGYPAGALSALRPGPGLVHEYDWGGYLGWSAPGTPVFIDGRLTPFVPRVVGDLTTILEAKPGWRETLSRLGVRQILVRPSTPVAVRAAELGWRVVARGTGFVLYDVPPP